jgi:hypothetical protein
MAIKRDLSELPAASDTHAEAVTPDPTPRFARILPDTWAKANAAREAAHKPSGAFFRHSDAGKCARAIAMRAAGVQTSDPMDLTGVWNVTLGTRIHDEWQAAIRNAYPDAEIERRIGIEAIDSVGYIDAVVTHEGRRVAIELKSIGGFGFKGAVGKVSKGRPAEGPKGDHVLQAALNAYAVDADEAVVAYLAKECISVNQGRDLTELGRFSAEWTYPRDVFTKLAEDEITRIAGIRALLEQGLLAARKHPDLPSGSEIIDPATGRWERRDADGAICDTGTHWSCNYCAYQETCVTTPSGRVPVESVVALDGAA